MKMKTALGANFTFSKRIMITNLEFFVYMLYINGRHGKLNTCSFTFLIDFDDLSPFNLFHLHVLVEGNG